MQNIVGLKLKFWKNIVGFETDAFWDAIIDICIVDHSNIRFYFIPIWRVYLNSIVSDVRMCGEWKPVQGGGRYKNQAGESWVRFPEL